MASGTEGHPRAPGGASGAAAPPPPPPPPPPPQPPLQRSATNRVIGGVCGGLAERTDIDPVVFRVVLAGLALVGGAGLILYGAAMLLLPDARTGRAVFDQVLHVHPGERFRIGGVLLVAVSLAVVAAGLAGAFGGGSLSIVVVAVVAALVAHRRGFDLRRPLRGAAGGFGSRRPPDPAQPDATIPAQPAAAGPAQPGATLGEGYVDLATLSARRRTPAPPPEPVPRPRSITWAVLLAAAAAGGAVAVLQEYGDLPGDVRVPLAAALAILGAGLVAATWLGRARVKGWGVLLALALGAATLVAGPLHGLHLKQVTWRPASVAQVQDRYSADIAAARLDLTDLPLRAGHTYDVEADVAGGRLTVLVPRDARVRVEANCGGCRGTVLGRRLDGFGTTMDQTFAAPGTVDGSVGKAHEGARPPTIVLDLTMGPGRLEVNRAP